MVGSLYFVSYNGLTTYDAFTTPFDPTLLDRLSQLLLKCHRQPLRPLWQDPLLPASSAYLRFVLRRGLHRLSPSSRFILNVREQQAPAAAQQQQLQKTTPERRLFTCLLPPSTRPLPVPLNAARVRESSSTARSSSSSSSATTPTTFNINSSTTTINNVHIATPRSPS